MKFIMQEFFRKDIPIVEKIDINELYSAFKISNEKMDNPKIIFDVVK